MNILIGIFRAVFGTGKKPVLNCVRHSEKYHRKNAHVHRHMQTKPLVAGKAKLPDSVDLRSNDNMKVFDQGDLGSCTTNATAAAFHFCEVKEAIRKFIPSRLVIYYNARYIDDNTDGEGCSITDAVKSLFERGVCSGARGLIVMTGKTTSQAIVAMPKQQRMWRQLLALSARKQMT